MKKKFIRILLLLSIFSQALPLWAVDKAVYDFTFTLPVPDTVQDREYLGLSDTLETFSLGQIEADIVLIEIFSMYCPICQREAENINQLYELLQADTQIGRRLKMIGIGAGNSQFEANFFKSNYSIEFPMFSDQGFGIHKKVNQVGTPHFFALHSLPDNRTKLFFSHSGPIDDPADFIKRLTEAYRLKESP